MKTGETLELEGVPQGSGWCVQFEAVADVLARQPKLGPFCESTSVLVT